MHVGNFIVALLSIACASSAQTGSVSSVQSGAATEESSTLATPTGNIEGTLDIPAARQPVPLALIIAGSGPTDRNGNTPLLPGANNSLKMLADGLAERGIASLRYDKRGIAQSKSAAGSESDLRFSTYIDDATAWVGKLRLDPRFSRIIIVGHSEGSLIGMVAAQKAGADAFVSLSGAGKPAQDILREQLHGRLPPDLASTAEEILTSLTRGTPVDSVPASLNVLFRPSVQPYLISWFRYSPAEEIAKLRVPILIVQGGTDIQVSVADARLLSAAAPSAKLLIIDGMNHILKDVVADREVNVKSYSDPSLPVDRTLLDQLAQFVRSVK